MKKIMMLFTAVAFTGLIANAQTDTTGIDYRYYPESNIYFNPQTKTYSWFDQTKASWTTGVQLPSSMQIKNEKSFNTIKYPGTDIWIANPDHIKTYGNKNNPALPKTSMPVPPPNATVPPRK
ncbi:MAG: hypothetical protein EOP53_11090 [Sphingobacteriales bacterium]|nr:MAG: hypothetical protein EOP53_11090 [Sphingobacteriales bacterium]